MELFKFTNTTTPTELVGAIPISNYDSLMWIERYRKAGEFELKARVSSGLKDILPIGTFISHVDTMEVMVVENHEIEEKKDSDSTITITGRSMETILENRVVGTNQAFTSFAYIEYTPYELAAAYPNQQAKKLINDHISDYMVLLENFDEFVDIEAETPTINEGEQQILVIKRSTVYDAMLALLELADLGIRVVRKHSFSHPVFSNSAETWFYIHKGFDKSSTVKFSADSGDFEDASYFWSNKQLKNAALVSGQYIEVLFEQESPEASQHARRVMLVDGSDIDREYDPGLTTGEKNAIALRMENRGRQALLAQKNIELVSVNISKKSRYRYRVDYDIGDCVSVYANYGLGSKLRVIENVEIQDTEGYISYPTLGAIEAI